MTRLAQAVSDKSVTRLAQAVFNIFVAHSHVCVHGLLDYVYRRLLKQALSRLQVGCIGFQRDYVIAATQLDVICHSLSFHVTNDLGVVFGLCQNTAGTH